MQVGIAYSDRSELFLTAVEVADGATVGQAIEDSGILGQFPQIDLARQKVGVFGKIVKLDARLNPGDRIEIYRAITCDPLTVPRRDGVGGDDD